MQEFLTKAGPLIYPLALCSLAAVAVTIERLFALRRARVLPREIVEVVGAVTPKRDRRFKKVEPGYYALRK